MDDPLRKFMIFGRNKFIYKMYENVTALLCAMKSYLGQFNPILAALEFCQGITRLHQHMHYAY